MINTFVNKRRNINLYCMFLLCKKTVKEALHVHIEENLIISPFTSVYGNKTHG